MIVNSLSNVKFINRSKHICDLCQEKRVLHLGATDSPTTEKSIESNNFLHFQLTKISKLLITLE